MGTIAVHEFTTLDGVIDAPMWTMDYPWTESMIAAIGPLMGPDSKAILLGRRTFEEFAPAWSTRTAEDDPGAPFMNDTMKYVVTSAGTTSEWRNSQVLGPYSAEAIRRLKDSVDGRIYVSGSGTLVRAMLADGLVDELHLLVYPVALGEGQRLFPEGGPKTQLRLIGCESFENEVVHLTYAST